MKLFWFPRIQTDVDKLHITTWREMYRCLAKQGVTVRLAIVGKDSDGVLQEVPYVRVAVIRAKFLRILSFWIHGYYTFIKQYFSFRPDVVILDIFSIWFSIPFVFLPKRNRAAFVLDNRTPHDDMYQQSGLKNKLTSAYVTASYKLAGRFFEGLTVINEYYKQRVCRDIGVDENRVGVWFSGVDIELFDSVSVPDTDLLPGEFTVMQHGSFTYDRGLFETLEALGRVANHDIHLVLLGDSLPGTDIKQELLTEAERLGVQDRFHILPPVPHGDIPKYVSACDGAVMAYPDIEYWNSNNPIKLLEYMAMGKVIICTDMPCFRNVIGDAPCAYYVQDNAPERVAAAMEGLYRNKDKLKSEGATGIEIIRDSYTWEMQADRLRRYLEHLI